MIYRARVNFTRELISNLSRGIKSTIVEDEEEQSTEVDILFPQDPNPPILYEFDKVKEVADKLIENEELSKDLKDVFMEFVREKVREKRRHNRERNEARRRIMEEMSQREMKI
ncbi:a-b binding protein [Prunus yedoensis var. nudiflora]|uniref:A-b binding protein n=1 Tax=Prunus yedoensis var. nudiflora TaxID=2094558 RepID=A0A314Z8A9_PRUYE|nr:a-b binding protein [Prunus yedoensis var. nudiflora]